MSKSLIIYFSRADENYAVGWIDKGNTEIVAEFVQELTGADMFKVEPAVPYAKDYNTCIRVFPRSIIASMFGHKHPRGKEKDRQRADQGEAGGHFRLRYRLHHEPGLLGYLRAGDGDRAHRFGFQRKNCACYQYARGLRPRQHGFRCQEAVQRCGREARPRRQGFSGEELETEGCRLAVI